MLLYNDDAHYQVEWVTSLTSWSSPTLWLTKHCRRRDFPVTELPAADIGAVGTEQFIDCRHRRSTSYVKRKLRSFHKQS